MKFQRFLFFAQVIVNSAHVAESRGFLRPSTDSPTDRQGLLQELQCFLWLPQTRVDLANIVEDESFAHAIAHGVFGR